MLPVGRRLLFTAVHAIVQLLAGVGVQWDDEAAKHNASDGYV
jgi:hypothetical protein